MLKLKTEKNVEINNFNLEISEAFFTPMSFIYRKAIAVGDRIVPSALVPLWKHPAGPKTVFFWAPLFKWGLVIAGIGDLQRPAEKLSVSQSSALAATGLIWSRYSLVITPKNWSLFSVNVFVACTSLYQVTRAVRYQQSLKPHIPVD